MKKILVIILLLFSGSLFASGVKLWPQITDGIYNQNNVLVMNCKIADDGLTVTDLAWDTYKVDGWSKRWTLNMGLPMTEPLKDYKFNKKWAGLPVNITVEFYNPEKPWEVKENYQEILLLGGKQTIGLPKWFSIPTNRLGYDFEENKNFPSGWTLPKGKYALWQSAAKVYQKDKNGKNPILDYGFTNISPFAFTKNGASVPRENRANLFGDNEWIECNPAGTVYKDQTNPDTWKKEPFFSHASQEKIIIADFEVPLSNTWQDYQYNAFRDIVKETREKYPDVMVGCWGIGVVNSSFRIFDDFDEQARGSGVVNLEGAKKWRGRYNNPKDYMNPVFKRCDLNVGVPSVYYINNSKPSQLYAFLQEWEMSDLASPDPCILSTWIQVEFVDGYPLSTYRFIDTKGKPRVEYIKHQVPASSTYALSLFGHCVMDGLECWDIGNYYSENLEDYSNWQENEPSVRKSVNGVETNMNYYIKYFGFYNYHVLGMWQASQNKDIIEAKTKWEMPEYYSSKNKIWRVGDERYPSFANFYKEPLVRVKYSNDKKILLVIASNPYNTDVEEVKVRVPNTKKEYSFELVGDYPIIKRFVVK